MGRKRALTLPEKEHVLAVYEKYHRIIPAAEELGVCEKTLRAYFRWIGFKVKVGRPKGATSVNTHYSCFANWLREHKGEKLPRSVIKIARLTGCTEKAVRSYLDRRRQAIEKQIGDLRKYFILLEDSRKWRIPTKAFRTYSLSLNVMMDTATITAQLRTGQTAFFRIPLADLLAKYKRAVLSESGTPG